MATTNEKVAHHTLTGHPKTDWSYVASYVAALYRDTLYNDPSVEDAPAKDMGFRDRLLAAGSLDQLSKEDQALVTSLTSGTKSDISYWPGGENYKVSLLSPDNPLGLPGDLWGAVTSAEDGAQVAALIEPDGDGNLNIMVPGGNGWEPLHDLGVIEGYTLVGLMPEAVSLYQKYDRDSNLGVVSSYPLSDTGPFPTEEQLTVPMSTEPMPRRGEDDEFWANSGQEFDPDKPVMASVVLNDESDLHAAIAAAAADPEIRWYVERRMAALGLEADLPWQKG